MKRERDLAGKDFGLLTVLQLSHRVEHGRSKWECLCRCGKRKVIFGTSLIQGKTKSCGCLSSDFNKKTFLGKMDPALAPEIHPKIKDIYWAAGIYEGEGSCHSCNQSQQAKITQKDRWILAQLRRMFGGSVRFKSSSNVCSDWILSGARARGFLMTIYPLLSPRRQEQVRRCLKK